MSSGSILDYRRGFVLPVGLIVGTMIDMRLPTARFLRSLDSVLRREEGQALVEYALVLFLVAVVVIGILGTLGNAVSSMFSVVNAEF